MAGIPAAARARTLTKPLLVVALRRSHFLGALLVERCLLNRD